MYANSDSNDLYILPSILEAAKIGAKNKVFLEKYSFLRFKFTFIYLLCIKKKSCCAIDSDIVQTLATIE